MKENNNALPLYAHSVSCGFPSPADDFLAGHLSLDAHLIHNPLASFFVKAQGDSMAPTILENDLLVVDRSLNAKNNCLVLATLDGEFTVKRLLKKKQQTVLQADNPKYKDILLTPEREFEVWGVISHVIHKVI